MEDTTLILREDGRLVYDGIAVGTFADGRITVNLGWAKAAGLRVKLLADPEVDTRRGGVVLDR